MLPDSLEFMNATTFSYYTYWGYLQTINYIISKTFFYLAEIEAFIYIKLLLINKYTISFILKML